ncbi:hypothetical protein ASD38_18545 [Caulobacter sp. Root487D2Y]|uniref:DUF4259 domain-containing protein n=1 Tax=Caulobacter sp. Root487D2Y TaxID=1736547 RepID=UPI0006F5A75C|nr:DUF4259 domain-containing protein [Caulobacter sp. Root487D2Y]KQY27374.1 hypothetical protein ASD38_18545 [Caulobacter sp. Root487D2Y]
MSAWAHGPFDNDDALDFIDDLAEAADWRTVVQILDHVTRTAGYLEAPEGQIAVAAAAIVAASVGDVTILPDNHRELKAALGAPPEGAVALARSALARVVAPASELDELWQEGDDHDAWLTQIAALQSTLSTAQ